MFRNLLDWAFKQADVTPSYQAHHCLAVRGHECRACADICPHEAITIRRTVHIENIDCTGCGLCVSACPSFALTPRHEAPRARSLRCSQVAGDTTASVTCLARLQPSTLAHMGASGHDVTLARGNCGACKIGSNDVPAVVERNLVRARAMLQMHGQSLNAQVLEVERLEVEREDKTLTRRELFQGSWQNVKRGGDVLLAPLEKLADDEPERPDRSGLPREHQLRMRAIELAQPEPDTRVPFRLPLVADGCILCPACTRVCPTQALKRVYDGNASGGSRLDLEPQRCIGCDACVDACPVDVVSMRDDVTWGEFTGPTQSVYRATPSFVPLEGVSRTPAGTAAPRDEVGDPPA